MDRKRQKLSPGKNDVQKECQDAKITALERKLEHMENKLKLNDVQRECQDEKITSLERKLEHVENKLKLVIAELEQVKEERAQDKINFETEKCELESKIDKYKEHCTELQSENEKLQTKYEKHESENEKLQSENKSLQKYFQELESENINVEERSQINIYNTDLKSQITKVIAELEQVKEERAQDKINFETEKCELESKIDKYKEHCTELQSENEKLQTKYEKHESENEKLQSENKSLQKYFQELESENRNVEERSQINIYNTDLKSQITKVNESNNDALNINSLPNEIILNVFGYIEQNQLGQMARVCKRWNVLTKSPLLWRKVNVKIFSSDTEKSTVTKSFINGLPSCVSFIRLDFSEWEDLIAVNFEELCVKLHQNCPHLEEFILTHCGITNILPEVINFCTQFLQCIKKLVFHKCYFPNRSRTVELNDNSKIEVLDLYCCYFSPFSKTQFSKLLYLKELRLYSSSIYDTWFEDDASFLNQLDVLDLAWTFITVRTFLAIQRHGHNLKELYLCEANLLENDLSFNNSVFPQLKTICLSCYHITCEGVVSLIQSCPSLENVYVYEDVAESFAAHPFVLANRCKSGIVKAIDWNHNHKVDYSHI